MILILIEIKQFIVCCKQLANDMPRKKQIAFGHILSETALYKSKTCQF